MGVAAFIGYHVATIFARACAFALRKTTGKKSPAKLSGRGPAHGHPEEIRRESRAVCLSVSLEATAGILNLALDFVGRAVEI